MGAGSRRWPRVPRKRYRKAVLLPGWCGMSFLSRKNSRPDRRGKAAAGRRSDSEYDDYGYAPEVYQDEVYQDQDDDTWSPDEYFSPEGIKGRWASGARPGERPGAGGYGGRDGGAGYDDPGAGYDDARHGDPGYGDARYGDAGYDDPRYGDARSA